MVRVELDDGGRGRGAHPRLALRVEDGHAGCGGAPEQRQQQLFSSIPGISFPKLDKNARKTVKNTVGAEFFSICGSGHKNIFEGKVAVPSIGKYDEKDKQNWVKTTANYLISKAFEMAFSLP